jgi:phage gp16-like protein
MTARLAVAAGGQAADRRRQELAKIHIGKVALALTDDSYRDLLERVGGKRSSADLSDQGRRLVLDQMARLGAYQAKPLRHAARYGAAQARMARGLWIELGDIGAIADASDAALDAFVQRQTGGAVSSARFLTDPQRARPVIEALKSWVGRTRASKGEAGHA